MKRLYICIVIFLAVIVSSWLSLWALKESTEQLKSAASACITSYDNDSPMLRKDIYELEQCWESYYNRVSFLTRSTSLEELAVSVSRLNDLLENQGGDFKSELNAIIYRCDVLYTDQLPLPQSVF